MPSYPFARAFAVAAVFLSFAPHSFARPILRFSSPSGTVVAIADYVVTTVSKPIPAADFTFDAADAMRLKKMFAANLGEQIRLAAGEKTILTPTVRAIPDGKHLHLTLNDQRSLDELTAALGTKP